MSGWLRRIFGRAGADSSAPAANQRADEPRERRAERPGGTIHRSDYLWTEREAEVLRAGDDGMPTAYLMYGSGRLVLVPDGLPNEMVNPRSRQLHRLGIYSFDVRGVGHYGPAVRAGNFLPGAHVRLVREPDNEHDANAIAVYAQDATRPAGYVNRQNAARLTKLLNAGAELAGISTRGGAPGDDGSPLTVLVAPPAVLTHLCRNVAIA